jgi:hypothetical protein
MNRPATPFGSLIAAAGGVLIELAYLTMPVATVPLIGSITAPALASEASYSGSLALLHLVPITAAIIIGIGLWLRLGNLSRAVARIAAVGILGCSLLAALAYLVPFNSLNNDIQSSWVSMFGIDATSFTGIGFWVALLGTIAAASGAIIDLARARVVGGD